MVKNKFIQTLFVPAYSIEKAKNITDKTYLMIYPLIGISVMLYLAASDHLGKLMSIKSVFLFCIIIGILSGLIAGYIASYLFFKLSGVIGMVDKTITLEQILPAFALSSTPLLFTGTITLIQYMIYGDIIFTKINVGQFTEISMIWYYVLEIIQLLILCWALILNVLVLSKLSDITAGQTFGTILISSLFIGGAGKVIEIIMYLIYSSGS